MPTSPTTIATLMHSIRSGMSILPMPHVAAVPRGKGADGVAAEQREMATERPAEDAVA